MNLNENDNCRFCGYEPETTKSIFVDCERFQNKQLKIFGNAYPNPPNSQVIRLKLVAKSFKKIGIFD